MILIWFNWWIFHKDLPTPLEKINQFGRIWHKLQYQINIHQCQCLIWNHRMNIFVWNEIKVWIRLVLSKRTRNTLKQSRMEWCTVSVEVQTVRDPFQLYLTGRQNMIISNLSPIWNIVIIDIVQYKLKILST